jgi:hypothetical protein
MTTALPPGYFPPPALPGIGTSPSAPAAAPAPYGAPTMPGMPPVAAAARKAGGGYQKYAGIDVHGEYVFALCAIGFKEGGKTWGGLFRVRESKATVQGVTPHPVGTLVSTGGNITTNRNAIGNLTDIVIAADGVQTVKTPDKGGDPTEHAKFSHYLAQKLAQLCAPQNATLYRGLLIRGQTYTSKKPIASGPNAGKYFVGMNWYHVPGQTAESLTAERAKLDAEGTPFEA